MTILETEESTLVLSYCKLIFKNIMTDDLERRFKLNPRSFKRASIRCSQTPETICTGKYLEAIVRRRHSKKSSVFVESQSRKVLETFIKIKRTKYLFIWLKFGD